MRERKLIVCRSFHDYQLRRHNPGEPAPWIRLKEAGFVIGLPVRVQIKKQQLIITPRS